MQIYNRPAKTLGFFYEALDKAFEQVEADYGPDVKGMYSYL